MRKLVGLALSLTLTASIVPPLIPSPWSPPTTVLPTRADLFPRFPGSPNVTVVSAMGMDPAEELLATSLQGVVNERLGRLYVDPGVSDGSSAAILATLRTRNNVTTSAATLDEALNRFAHEAHGLIVYDPTVPDSVNVATTLAGIDHALLVDPAMAEDVGTRYSLPVLEDLRRPPWAGLLRDDLYRLAWQQLGTRTNNSVLGYLEPDRIGPRDYLIAARAFVFYVDVGPLASPSDIALLRDLFREAPANAAVLGWPQTSTGAEENFLVQEVSHAGKFLVGAQTVPNLSLLSGYPRTRPKMPVSPPLRTSPGNGVFISFAIPDGDNLDFVNGREMDLWNEPVRGNLPIAWSISPALAELAPVYLDLLYGGATANDSFLAAPSGAGLAFPGLLPERALDPFLLETASLMRAADVSNLWLLNGYRSYEVPFPTDVLSAYASSTSSKGLLLDYGDRPTTSTDWMAGGTPVTRSFHLWGSDANLVEKVRLELESAPAPHFLVVVLYPYTKDLGDLARAAGELSALDPQRVEFVSLDSLFGLMQASMLDRADSLAAQVHRDPVAHFLASGVVAAGDRALTAAHSSTSPSEAAAAAFSAISSYEGAEALSEFSVLALATAALLSVLLLRRWRTANRSAGALRAPLVLAAAAAGASALLVSGAMHVMDGNFWDYPALAFAYAALWFVRPLQERFLWTARGQWLAAAVGLGLGTVFLIWTAYALIPLACGVVLVLREIRKTGSLPAVWWTPAIGLGALAGFVGGWGIPVTSLYLLLTLLGSLRLPTPARRLPRPDRDGSLERTGAALLTATPFLLFGLLESPFLSVRLSWGLGLTVPLSIAFFAVVMSLVGIASRIYSMPSHALAIASVAGFLLADVVEGPLLIGSVAVGVAAAIWLAIQEEADAEAKGRSLSDGTTLASFAILFVAWARIQPVYFSVYLAPLPAWAEGAMYHPPILMAAIVATGALGVAWGRRHPLGPPVPSS